MWFDSLGSDPSMQLIAIVDDKSNQVFCVCFVMDPDTTGSRGKAKEP